MSSPLKNIQQEIKGMSPTSNKCMRSQIPFHFLKGTCVLMNSFTANTCTKMKTHTYIFKQANTNTFSHTDIHLSKFHFLNFQLAYFWQKWSGGKCSQAFLNLSYGLSMQLVALISQSKQNKHFIELEVYRPNCRTNWWFDT